MGYNQFDCSHFNIEPSIVLSVDLLLTFVTTSGTTRVCQLLVHVHVPPCHTLRFALVQIGCYGHLLQTFVFLQSQFYFPMDFVKVINFRSPTMKQYRWLVLIATVISTGLNTLNDFIIYSFLSEWLLIGLNPPTNSSFPESYEGKIRC